MRSLFPTTPLATRLRRAALLCLTALMVGALGACPRRSHAPAPDAEDESGTMPIPEFVFVAVDNHNWGDVIVWLVNSGGQRVRLGTVTAGSSATLRFPGSYIAGSQALQLQARAIGGRAGVTSERFTVMPGQQVVWTLESSLGRSSLAVY